MEICGLFFWLSMPFICLFLFSFRVCLPKKRSTKKEKTESSSKNTWKSGNKKLKFSYKEQREFETIDEDIAKLEEKIEKLDAQMEANATNSVKLKELIEEKEKVEAQLEEKMDRWVYLNDLNERILNGDE